ncbi:heavy-metal-associated domain-containing protein [Mycobacterium avium subsp. hominissuis]
MRVTLRCREGSDMTTVTVTVTGMTCGHCASSVREEVGNIPDVRAVGVDLASGEVIIESDGPIDAAAIKDAVVEAGYALAG